MEPENHNSIALRITAIYVLAGTLWILFSDKLAGALVGSINTFAFIGIVKGVVYVIASGVLMYFLVNNALRKLNQAKEQLLARNKELSSAKDEISAAYKQLTESEGLLKEKYDESLKTQQELLTYRKTLHDLAYIDQLTGLPNQLSLNEKIESILETEERFAFLFLDIDNFKFVNDTLGHPFGDHLLEKLSEVVGGVLEGNCSLYRLGGDKFIVLVEEFKDVYEIERVAVNILKTLKNPVDVDDRTFYNTASIGVCVYPDHGGSFAELLKHADIALVKAKENGKNRIVIFSEPMKQAVQEWADIEKYLRSALGNSEFELYYQPQYDIKTRKITGFEALIRWRNDEMGFVMPNSFIRVAEDTNLIIPIGEWVLRNACIFIKRLQQEGYGDLSVSVNVSMLQLLQDDFVEVVTETVEMANIDPGNLEIELTESIVGKNYEMIIEKMRILRKLGVKIALDDFGKGYSSLNYLRKLPITTLKIDKSFISVISENDSYSNLTDFIVKIGQSLDLCIVAEGIETQKQLEYLSELDCDKMQGYLMSRPLPEKDAIDMLRRKDKGA
ncbi:MAG TPA: EAL domain-containing protein [Clostridia bacterium]|nr:EAL domain-containing protein [Clostridia bacterium]